MFCEQVVNWFDAEQPCQNQPNYLLVMLNDATEQTWLASTAQSYSSTHWWWIGYHHQNASLDNEPNGNWQWIDGSSSGYSNWDVGQPDDWLQVEDCGQLHTDGTWNALDCSLSEWSEYRMYYICEASTP